MCAHIWLGLLTIPFVAVHGGFPWGGVLANLLMVVYAIVMLSGVFGLIVQQFLPAWMLDTVPEETIYSQIEVVAAGNLQDADALVAAVCGIPSPDWTDADKLTEANKPGRPQQVVVGSTREATLIHDLRVRVRLPSEPIDNTVELLRAYATRIRPHLSEPGGQPPLQNERESQSFFHDIRTRTSPAAETAISHLEDWCRQRRQFSVQGRIHYWLYAWLAVHLPLSVLLVGLLGWHAIVALKYSGTYSFF